MTLVALCYHGIASEIVDSDVQSAVQMPEGIFVEQIEHLARSHDIVPIRAVPDILRGDDARGASKALLTFDDGYRNVLTVAAPLLRARRIPFAVFVSTHHVSTGLRFPTYVLRAAIHGTRLEEIELPTIGRRFMLADRDARAATVREVSGILKRASQPVCRALVADLRSLLTNEEWRSTDMRFHADAPLDWSEARDLAACGADIGAHGHEHSILHGRQPEDEVRREVRVSRRILEDEIGRCATFAYPNGGANDISAFAIEAVRAEGYEMAFAAMPGVINMKSPRFLLPRIFAPHSVDALQARIEAAGAAAVPVA